MTDGEMFEALWARAKAEGLNHACYFGGYPPHEEGLEGRFDPDPWRNGTGPQIWLYRVPCPEPRDEPVVDGPYVSRELRVFAHEYGHFRSWVEQSNGATRTWQAYFQAGTLLGKSPGSLSGDQKQLIMMEEERAWDIARDVLSEIGFSNWQELKSHREHALGIYREKMGMDGSGRDA